MARLAPSLVRLRDEVNARWPNRDKTSDGWIGDARHATRRSDHNPDANGIVRAIDIDEDLDGDTRDTGRDAWSLAETLRISRDPRIKYVIYEGQMFSSYASGGVPAWTWRPYAGGNKHLSHIHVSILPTAKAAEDTSPWLPGPLAAPPPRTLQKGGTCMVKLPVLRHGDKGGDVKSLQVLLVSKAGQYVGPKGPDGVFGRATDSAVRNVQKFFGLKVDGIVGEKTWPCLFL